MMSRVAAAPNDGGGSKGVAKGRHPAAAPELTIAEPKGVSLAAGRSRKQLRSLQRKPTVSDVKPTERQVMPPGERSVISTVGSVFTSMVRPCVRHLVLIRVSVSTNYEPFADPKPTSTTNNLHQHGHALERFCLVGKTLGRQVDI